MLAREVCAAKVRIWLPGTRPVRRAPKATRGHRDRPEPPDHRDPPGPRDLSETRDHRVQRATPAVQVQRTSLPAAPQSAPSVTANRSTYPAIPVKLPQVVVAT